MDVPLPAERATDAAPTPRPRTRGRRYYKSGFYALKVTLRALGPRLVDRRTHLGKQLAAWRADLVRDLGSDVSTQQAAIIDLAVKTKLLLDSIDAWLLTQPSLVNRRRRALLPVVRERQTLADALARYLVQLALERRAKPVADLASYLAAKTAQMGSARARAILVTVLDALDGPALQAAVHVGRDRSLAARAGSAPTAFPAPGARFAAQWPCRRQSPFRHAAACKTGVQPPDRLSTMRRRVAGGRRPALPPQCAVHAAPFPPFGARRAPSPGVTRASTSSSVGAGGQPEGSKS